MWLKGADLKPVECPEWDEMAASLSGPGSENEKKFLFLLRDNGFPLPDKVHYGIPYDGTPVAEVDFKVGRLHVFVDGSVHHAKWISEVDDIKREALRHGGYHVFEFDMDYPDRSLSKLKELL